MDCGLVAFNKGEGPAIILVWTFLTLEKTFREKTFTSFFFSFLFFASLCKLTQKCHSVYPTTLSHCEADYFFNNLFLNELLPNDDISWLYIGLIVN